MKYKIKSIRKKSKEGKEIIEFANGFDYGVFLEWKEQGLVPYRPKKKKNFLLLGTLWQKLIAFAEKIRVSLKKRLLRLRGRREDPHILPALCGALCGALCVTIIAFGAVVYKLFIRDYFGAYQTVYVPDLVGTVYNAESFESYTEYCNITLKHEYSNAHAKGTVISQTPSAGTARRLYKDRSNCNVEITVSLGKKQYSVPKLCGISQRDAALELKNSGIAYSVSQIYSETCPKGYVVSTDPPENSLCDDSTSVVLYISLGKKTVYLTVPSLSGLTESRAAELLQGLGFTVGSVTYSASDAPFGTVISQSAKTGERLPAGSAVSFSVSAGEAFCEKLIPDLYGATVDEARQKLAEVGLILGNIYAVSGASKSSTVVAQFPVCGTKITPDISSVDIYVNS